MHVTTIGNDLANTGFNLAGADKHRKIMLRKSLPRKKLLSLIAQCPPCLIASKPAVARTTGPASLRSSVTSFNFIKQSVNFFGVTSVRLHAIDTH